MGLFFAKFKAMVAATVKTQIGLMALFLLAPLFTSSQQAHAYEESARMILRLDANNVNLRSERHPHRPFARVNAGTEIEIAFDPSLLPQGRSPSRADLVRIVRSMESSRVPRRTAEGNLVHFPAQGVLIRSVGEGSSANLPENVSGLIHLNSLVASGSLSPVHVLVPGQQGYAPVRILDPQAAREPAPAASAVTPPARHSAPLQAAPLPPRRQQDFFSAAARALLGPSRMDQVCDRLRSYSPEELARSYQAFEAIRSQSRAARLGTQRFSQTSGVERMIAHARRFAYPESNGQCLAKVRDALHVGGLTPDRIMYPYGSRENWAVNFGPQLAARGFRNLMSDPQSAGLIRSPEDAPVGAVLVYEGTNQRNHKGHTEIRTSDGYVSDYFSRRAVSEGAGGRPNGYRLIGVWVPR